jgi:hypothetical protein
LKHVILKVSHEKLKTLKTAIKEAKTLFPRADISPVKQGNLGDDIMASFTIDDDHYQRVIEKIKKAGIIVLGNEPKTEHKKVANTKPVISTAAGDFTVSSSLVPKNDSPAAILDFAIKNGDYEKVILFSKDYRIGFEVLKKAKDNVDLAIKNSIDIAYLKALKNKFEVSKCLTQLIKIASDKDLKNLHKNDQIKAAGLKAVELCSIYREYINILVQICNNNSMPHIVCMKAAIKLAYFLSDDDEKSEENLDYAVRYLNLRWLNIVFYTVSLEISEKEKEIFRVLITSIKERFGTTDTAL